MGNSLRDVRNRDVAPEPTWMYSRRSRKEFPMAAPRSDLSKSCGYAESSKCWSGEFEQALLGFGDEEVDAIVASTGAVDANKTHCSIRGQ